MGGNRKMKHIYTTMPTVTYTVLSLLPPACSTSWYNHQYQM